VAVELPEIVREHLAHAVGRLHDPEPPPTGTRAAIRWTAPASWHLTLVFCAAVSPDQETSWTAGLGPALARHGSLRLAVTAGGRFGQRVLWAGIAGDRAALRSVAASVSAAARSAGIDVEDRPYRPHLTIARGAPGAKLGPAAAALSSYEGPAWVAHEVVLIHSELGAGPERTARHTVVQMFPLG
jgi:2'-5' RNA ligase